ncbi:MAG TPA: thermonuclease family protein [Methylomirabilota bacterium]|nr:thermonuclease family protein [Methylomirabilota bacterium]
MRARHRLPPLVVLALVLWPVLAGAADCAMPRKPAGLAPASVVRVVDGDTLVVHLGDGRSARVRLIGVDTPELHASDKLRRDAQRSGKDAVAIQALGAKASDFTKKHLSGRKVELERDATPVDRHGRTLAYVWLGEELYNLVILREGYASPLTVPPNVKYADTLAACHRTARQARRGLWAASE